VTARFLYAPLLLAALLAGGCQSRQEEVSDAEMEAKLKRLPQPDKTMPVEEVGIRFVGVLKSVERIGEPKRDDAIVIGPRFSSVQYLTVAVDRITGGDENLLMAGRDVTFAIQSVGKVVYGRVQEGRRYRFSLKGEKTGDQLRYDQLSATPE